MSMLRRIGLACTFAAALLLQAPSARADGYDPQRSGHPLRIVAYVLYPVGFTIDYLIMRPAWWVGQHEPFHTLFGVEDD